jgi:hypothetical protein
VEAELPAGYNRNQITLQGQAMDIFLSSALAVSTVIVNRNENLNLSQSLSTNVASGFSTGNVHKVFQTINNVSILNSLFYLDTVTIFYLFKYLPY